MLYFGIFSQVTLPPGILYLEVSPWYTFLKGFWSMLGSYLVLIFSLFCNSHPFKKHI